jgi:UPF0176 protein
LIHTAFYKFVPLADPTAAAQVLRRLCSPLVQGSIIVAQEGINGVLAGTSSAVAEIEAALRSEPSFQGAFTDLHFKHSQCVTPPFGRLKVQVKAQIVAVGGGVIDIAVDTAAESEISGIESSRSSKNNALNPEQWRVLMAEEDVVVLDNRNSFEYRLGHFKGAVDPGVNNFRDFTQYVKEQAPSWRAQAKRVAMYCTGGVRCEKTSAWMQAQGLEVYQLDGGVLNYFETLSDAERDWQGECFVFDNRVALDTRLQESATTAEQVYRDSDEYPDEQWRLQRARRLARESDQH